MCQRRAQKRASDGIKYCKTNANDIDEPGLVKKAPGGAKCPVCKGRAKVRAKGGIKYCKKHAKELDEEKPTPKDRRGLLTLSTYTDDCANSPYLGHMNATCHWCLSLTFRGELIDCCTSKTIEQREDKENQL